MMITNNVLTTDGNWRAEFNAMVSTMGSHVSRTSGLAGMYNYLNENGLSFENDVIVPEGVQYEKFSVDINELFRPGIMACLAYVPVISYRNEPGVRYEAGAPIAAGIESYVAAHLTGLHSFAQVEIRCETTIGVALVPDAASSFPAVALYKWETRALVFYDHAGAVQLFHPTNAPLATFVPHVYDKEGTDPNSVCFSFAGSDGFDQMAAQANGRSGPFEDQRSYHVWNPGVDADEALRFPTCSPAATIASLIERNLLYASPQGQQAQRIDTLLAHRAGTLVSLTAAYQENAMRIIAEKRSAASAEWVATAI